MEFNRKYAYYPGCALESTAREYNQSVLAVSRDLGIELSALPDWSCCGASSAHMTDSRLAHALPAMELARAESAGLDIAVACPACYQRLKSTQLAARENPELAGRLRELTGWTGSELREIRHVMEIIYNEVGSERIKERITRPLGGLKVVCYYGCYLVRPRELTGFDDPENPIIMDQLMATAGAQALDWDGKVDCCGGSLSLADKGVTTRLVGHIFEAARDAGAEAVVTACPLCQLNLETRQGGDKPLPVFYFTELLGLALGLPAGPWFRRHLVNPSSLLKSHRLPVQS